MIGRNLAALAALCLMPCAAQADIFGFRLGPKLGAVTGSGDIYTNFNQPVAGGLELGIEVLFIDIFAEAFVMGSSQFMFTVNGGFDTTIGEDFRLTLGLYTGPMFYVFPKEDPEAITVPSDVRQQLESYGVNVDKAIEDYDEAAAKEADLSRLAFGWNVARLRVEADMKIAPAFFLGLQFLGGYHFLIDGTSVAAGAKNAAIDAAARENNLNAEAQQVLRDLVGAEPVDTSNLNGVNYTAGLYLRLEL